MSSESVYQKIKESMTSSKEIGEKIFRGKLQKDQFKITPYYFLFYNGYLPVLIGEINRNGLGSKILITIRPDLIQVSSFMLIFLFFLAGFAFQLAENIKYGKIFNEAESLMMYLGFFIVFYILSMISYMPNILKYKKMMQEALEAEETIQIGLFEKYLK